jgi:pSer/pThr/pTyr-binding forkhead associated (FHA) protein
MASLTGQTKKGDVDETKPRGVATPLRLVMQISDGGDRPRIVSIPLQEKLTIGRGGTSGDSQPDIDLSGFHGLENGVSRIHAQFTYDGEYLSLEDAGSTNGTRINGFQISPARPYRLRNGDEIEIGRVRLAVSVVRIPG